MQCTATSMDLNEGLEFIKNMAAKAMKDETERQEQQKVNTPCYPREDANENDHFMWAPMCPGCRNVDPRALLSAKVRAEIGCESVPTSIEVVAMYASSGAAMRCLACNTRFHFKWVAHPFKPEDPNQENARSVSRRFLEEICVSN